MPCNAMQAMPMWPIPFHAMPCKLRYKAGMDTLWPRNDAMQRHASHAHVALLFCALPQMHTSAMTKYATSGSTASSSSKEEQQQEAAKAVQQQEAAKAVHSPLQSLMDAATSADAVQRDGGGPAAGVPRQKPYRSWVWYDAEDERLEQAKERSGRAERYVP